MNAIEIYVPYQKRVIEEAPTVDLGTVESSAAYKKYRDLLLGISWDSPVHELALRFSLSDRDFLQSPHAMRMLECEVVARIQRFIIFCENAGFRPIPAWKLVIENIHTTMFGFQFIFHYSAE